MAAIKELQVYLTKIDYLGFGERSSDIGDDLVFEFTRRGDVRKVKPDDLEHGESKNFNTPLLYKRLSESDFPYYIDIQTVAREVDSLPLVDITDDININPVPTTNYIVNKSDKNVPHQIEIEVHEDANPQKHMAVFVVHFKAVLNDLPHQEEENMEGSDSTPDPEEIDKPIENPGTTTPSGPSPFPIPGPLTPESPIDIPFGYYLENILTDEMDILAFVSDTHIGADDCLDDFDAQDDDAFAAMINFLTGLKGKTKELILLGDLIELWETKPHYINITGIGDRIDASKTKISKIVRKHKPVFEAIKTFSEKHKVTYVYGNHDDELTEGEIRRHFINETGINALFGMDYSNQLFEVFAQHGHQFDKNNFSTNPLGEIPLGRWIVENFIAPMEEIKVNGQCGLFSPIDSFEKTENFVDYVECLNDQSIITSSTFNEVDEVIRNMNNNVPLTGVSNVLAGTMDFVLDTVEAAGLANEMDQFKIAAKLVEFFKLGIRIEESDYSGLLNGTNRSCILMGHTHEGYVKKLGASKVIINTGTWQDKLIGNKTQPCQPNHISNRHLTVLIKRKSTRAAVDDGQSYPENSDIIEVLMYSVFPTSLTETIHTWYFLDP